MLMHMRVSVETVKLIKDTYHSGDRIVLDRMGYDPDPIPSGTTGTVIGVDDIGTVHVNWDNGRKLGLIPGHDSFRKI